MLSIERIDDLADPRVALYRDLADSALRDAQGVFLVESRLCVQRLLDYGRQRVRSLLLTEPALAALRGTLDAHEAEFPIYLAAADLLKRIVGYNLHRGCIAAAERGAGHSLAALLAERPALVVGLERVANPENVGNVFRNAIAFAADAVVLSTDCADPLYRKAVRVSMAGSLRVPFARVAAWPEALGTLRAAGFQSVAFTPAAEAHDLRDLAPADLATPTVLLFGAEGEGLRDATVAAADRAVRIPMARGVDSLNVATASGVALHHVFERRVQRSLDASRSAGSNSNAE